MKKFWNWKNENGSDERILEIYGTIAPESWFDDDVTPKLFKEELSSGSGPVTVWINSPGGDCIAASQIYTMLRDYKGGVTVKIDGLAASAASVIAMAGSKVLISPTAMIMIHNPSTEAKGDHNDFSKAIDLLNEVKESIINAYELKSKQSRAVLSHLMDNETWMNAKKAIELGFADGILEDAKVGPPTESFSFSTREFQNVLLNKIKEKEKVCSVPQTGRNVKDLKKALSAIKNYI